ncbi:phage holin family protein [Actinomyces gerencseriae]|uniref:phage holin family protein n=1 Tax=Actinomyces gerencseriae TaxID=52769 RepID=UPI0023F1D0E1|nr:phage holin family protein [Actinomyces gerencseriae]
MEFLVRTIGNAVGLWLATTFIRGMDVPGTPTTLMTIANLLVVGLVLALVNSLIKPVARFLAFPLYVLTFGLFALVVNGAMLLLTSAITDRLVGVGAQAGLTLGLHVDSFGSAILGSILVSIASALVVGVVGSRDE